MMDSLVNVAAEGSCSSKLELSVLLVKMKATCLRRGFEIRGWHALPARETKGVIHLVSSPGWGRQKW